MTSDLVSMDLTEHCFDIGTHFGACHGDRNQTYQPIMLRDLCMIEPEPLAQLALDAITIYSSRKQAFRDNQTEPRMRQVIASPVNGKVSCACYRPVTERRGYMRRIEPSVFRITQPPAQTLKPTGGRDPWRDGHE
jgi:hypothetical protein